MSHLENEKLYQRLDEDHTERFAEEVTSVLIDMMDRKRLIRKPLITSDHKNYGLHESTSYQKSITTGFKGDR